MALNKNFLFFLLIVILTCFSFFSCSTDLEGRDVSTGLTFAAPGKTEEMAMVSRNPGEELLSLKAELINSETEEVIDSFSLNCKPEEVVTVELQGSRGTPVYVSLRFTDPDIDDLVWASGKTDAFYLQKKKTTIDINLEYKGLGIYLEKNPFVITAKKADGTVLENGKGKVKPTDVVIFTLSNGQLKPIKQVPSLNGMKIEQSKDNSNGFSLITLDLSKQPGLKYGENKLEVALGFGDWAEPMYHSSFVFNVEN